MHGGGGIIFFGSIILGFGLVILYLTSKDTNPLLKAGSYILMAVGLSGIIVGIFFAFSYGFACDRHGNGSHHGNGGYGYHMQGAGHPVMGGKRWSECAGKFQGKVMDEASMNAVHECMMGK